MYIFNIVNIFYLSIYSGVTITGRAKEGVIWIFYKDWKDKVVTWNYINSRKVNIELRIDRKKKVDCIVVYEPKEGRIVEGIRHCQ